MEYIIYIVMINSYFVLSRQEYFKRGLRNILERITYGSITKEEQLKPENEFAFLFEKNYYFGVKGDAKEHFLDLSSLNITDDLLSSEVFDEFQHIRELNLRNNRIQNLPQGIFDNMKELELVSLKSNSIENINEDVFKHNSRLQYIEFTGTINTNLKILLHGKTHLKKLDMRPYTLASYDKDVFSDLTNLEEIIFGSELITILEKFPAILEPLSSLNKLIVENIRDKDISIISKLPIDAEILLLHEDKIDETIIDPLVSFYENSKLTFLRTKKNSWDRKRKQERDRTRAKRKEVEAIVMQKELSIDEKINLIIRIIGPSEFIEMFNKGIFDNHRTLVKQYFCDYRIYEFLREEEPHYLIEFIDDPKVLEQIILDEQQIYYESEEHNYDDSEVPSSAVIDLARAKLYRLQKSKKQR